MTTLIVVDNRTLDRQGLLELLGTTEDLIVMAAIDNAREAYLTITRLRPDIAILSSSVDYHCFLHRIVEATSAHSTRLLWLTTHECPRESRLARQLGIPAILAKENSFDDLVAAITVILHGGEFMLPTLKAKVRTSDDDAGKGLSDREREVIREVANGLTSKEIARKLALSPKTIETYKSRVMLKLGTRGIAALIRYSLEHGLQED